MAQLFRLCRLVLLALLVIVAFPGILKTPVKLVSMYQGFWLRREQLRLDWRTERAGEDVLSPKVRTMLALLRDNHVQSFRYSEAIANDVDTSVVQRIAESAYPIRLRQEGPHFLLLVSEILDSRCKTVARESGVVLAHCP